MDICEEFSTTVENLRAKKSWKGCDLRVCVVGQNGSGKSAIVLQEVAGSFVDDYDPTVEDSFRKSLSIAGFGLCFSIYDTGGSEFHFSWAGEGGPIGWPKMDAYIVVFDITNRESFDGFARKALRLIGEKFDCKSVLLVGNKFDLDECRTVSTIEGVLLAFEFRTGYCEASAKTRFHVEEIFEWVYLQHLRVHSYVARRAILETPRSKKCQIM